MGTYHSYPGDAKLEDSKDNWYRISGMNISRWNVSPIFNNWSTGRTNEYNLFSNNIGYLGNNKSVWSYCYAKILNYTTNPFSSYNTWSMIIPVGRAFTIKDRSIYEGKTIASTNTGESGKNIYIGTHSGNAALGIYSVFITAANNIASSGEYPPTTTIKFRPMLTLKPVSGGVIDKFTLKIQVTRYLTILRPSVLYRLGFAISFLEGNESIIAERKYGYRIGRHGLDLADSPEYVSRAVANQYIVATSPSEGIAVNVEHGGVNIYDQIGCWWKLINGKCLYIPSFHSLPGMEQDWRNNGGVTTSIVTFTEADAYSI